MCWTCHHVLGLRAVVQDAHLDLGEFLLVAVDAHADLVVGALLLGSHLQDAQLHTAREYIIIRVQHLSQSTSLAAPQRAWRLCCAINSIYTLALA